MEDEKDPSPDLVLPLGPLGDGSILTLRKRPGQPVAMGRLVLPEEGRPAMGMELMTLSPHEGGPACEVEVVHDGRHPGSGPAMVNNARYRSGWDAVFRKGDPSLN
jgi:hypothetical protein